MSVISILFGLYWAKSAFVKVKKPYMYYIAIKDYGVLATSPLLFIIVTFIIMAEILSALLFLTVSYAYLAVGLAIFLLVIQICLLVKGFQQTHENNCGCFPNAPKTVTTKHLMYPFVLIVLLIIYLGIDVNFVNKGEL